ncbi:outer membrane protein OmpA-like peptidoglycan-associated protein/tetratricopeptide (TPR) repeat protein [Pontibacter aydingkolensis]|uniref:OmpA family protein n=1 Tax=Pontibacter aydingkolensis TaxID=1911536 RepID=A0ABS7CZE9_9BACT|nr:OmpA family protein [Pontibacter aydingkolensis]MBW7469195.1 OmpA family protein [Pontibacter aydingkolensis]
MSHLAKSLSRFSLLLVFLFLFAASVSAQSTRKQMRTANKFFERENYREAIPFYEQVLASDPNDAKALYRAGISYMTFDKEKSADYLYRAQKLKPNVDRDIEYWLGRTDHINYRFDSAIDHFQKYQKEIPRRNEERREEVAQLIQHARNAKKEVANPKDVFVKNMGGTVNTAYSEHSPVISSDFNYLLFTSRGEKATGGKAARDGEFYEDIFETRRIGDDEWEPTRIVPGALNSPGHDASIQLFDNDTKMLLYSSVNNGDIMVSERQADGSWGAPKSISDRVNTKDFESDAYITPDGNTLFFSTSHYSENGDLDLYVVQRNKNGSWGTPRSLGTTINSPFDDDSPYLASDGTLFFASRGHNSMGGYDIFSAKFDSVARRWSRPVNLGSPINTPDDDTYYRLAPDGSYAYLSSYRIGGYGEKDIYTINYIRNAQIKGQVFSKVDSTLIPGVELIFNSTQADKRPISYRDVTKPDSATYAVQVLSGRMYQVQVSKDGKLITTEEVEVPMSLDDTTSVTRNFYLDYVDKDGIKPGVTTTGKFAMQNIYYDTDKYELRPESIKELDNIVRILKQNPEINISIEGHTDSRASDQYNMTLGENRAGAAYDYLVKQGISPRRLVTVSYGERRPAVANDSAENMQLNRRTMFRVIPREGDSQQQNQQLNNQMNKN